MIILRKRLHCHLTIWRQYEFEEGNDFIKTQDLQSPKLGSAKSGAVIAINHHVSHSRYIEKAFPD